jgi:hypothetical protein
MITVDVRADIKQVQRFLNVTKAGVRRAASRAINDSLVTVRAEGARDIKKDHPALSIGDIKQNMVMTRSTPRTLTGMVDTKGKPLSLTLFRPKGGEGSRRKIGARGQVSLVRTSRPITAQIGRKRGPVQYHGRKAFRVLQYHNEIFVRTHAKGRQLRRFRGPSMPGVFRAKGSRFKSIAMRRWAATFPSRMKFEIEKAKSRA